MVFGFRVLGAKVWGQGLTIKRINFNSLSRNFIFANREVLISISKQNSKVSKLYVHLYIYHGSIWWFSLAQFGKQMRFNISICFVRIMTAIPATIVTNKTVRRQEGFIMTSSVCHQGITIIVEKQPQSHPFQI